MSHATRHSWRTKPLPIARADLRYDEVFSADEADRMMRGFVPKEMEDRWFIFFEEGWLYFHRSWTGFCVYALRLESASAGVRVVESRVSRDPAEYTGTDLEEDREIVGALIRHFLLAR